jgi:hypothetical protein
MKWVPKASQEEVDKLMGLPVWFSVCADEPTKGGARRWALFRKPSDGKGGCPCEMGGFRSVQEAVEYGKACAKSDDLLVDELGYERDNWGKPTMRKYALETVEVDF